MQRCCNLIYTFATTLRIYRFNMKRILFLLFFFGMMTSAFAQTLKAKVVDAKTGLPIPYAKVVLVELSKGSLSDINGDLELNIRFKAPFHLEIKANSYAQKILALKVLRDTNIVIHLDPEHISFDEVRVESALGEMSQSTIVNTDQHTLDDLNKIVSPNLSESLNKIPGVSSTTLGAGISKPVVRGLTGSRVLTYLNGLRIENQQWGGDHGLGVNELGISKVELIKGPASLLYGADALGGVVYLIDEKYANENTIESQLASSIESVNGLIKNSVGLKFGGGNLKINVFGSFNSAADYQLPSGSYLKNSRFQNRNFKAAIGYHKKNWVANLRYNYSAARIGIPGHTHDSVVELNDFISSNAKRAYTLPAQQIENHYLSFENKLYFKQSTLTFNLGQSWNGLKEFEEKVTIPALFMNLNTTTLNLRYAYSFSKTSQLILGTQAMVQQNRNDITASEQIIPNANQNDLGVFAILKGKIKNLDCQLGIRGDLRKLNVLDSSTLRREFTSVNYSAGIAKIEKHYALRFNVSSGFRAPHTSELLANGVHHGTFRYEIGKQDLKSEYATQIDLGIEFKSEHIEMHITPFYNHIENFIYITPNGNEIETYQVFNYEQGQAANMYGVDLNFHYHPHSLHNLHMIATGSFIQAAFANGDFLPLQPQNNAGVELSYSFESKRKFELSNLVLNYNYFMAQKRVVSYESFSSAYDILNLGANFKVKTNPNILIQLGARNILNKAYIPHLSQLKNYGIQAPGRSFYLAIKFNLKSKINEK